MKREIDVIILAAGKGTRMKSDLPKVLTPVAGKPIIIRLIDAVRSLNKNPILVVGHKAEEVKAAVKNARFVLQTEQKGTGHAVATVLQELKGTLAPSIVVMPGDHPLVCAKTFETLSDIHATSRAKVTLATLVLPHFNAEYSVFNNYGRVIRNEKGDIVGIKEFKDSTESERAILEVNPSYYCFDTKWLTEAISKLSDNNASGELYLTDVIALASSESQIISSVALTDYSEAMGINTPEQKTFIEGTFFKGFFETGFSFS